MSTKSENFLIGSDLQSENAGNGLTRQIMGYDEDLMLVRVKFEKGGIGILHQHVHCQSSYIVSGVFEVNVNGVKKVLREGDGFYIEPDVMHGAVCLEEGIIIDTFSPVRHDFLKQ